MEKKKKEILTQEIEEKELKPLSGMAALVILILLILAAIAAAIWGAVEGNGVVVTAAVLVMVIAFVLLGGLKVINPNEADRKSVV